MAKISVIAKKEVSDAISCKTFLLTLVILMLSMAIAGAISGKNYSNEIGIYRLYNEDASTLGLMIIGDLVPHVQTLGALVAVTFGFSAIHKERTEGSLKVLLSYPIYRDEVILGKLLAGFLVVSLTTIASLAVSLAIYIYSTNMSYTPVVTLRFATFTLLSVLLISGYLGLSIFFSIAFKDPKTSLLAMFLIIGLFNSHAFHAYGRILSEAVYGPELRISDVGIAVPLHPQAYRIRDFIGKLSPSYGYERISFSLYFPSLLVLVEDDLVFVPNEFWSVIRNHLYSIVVLAIIPVVTFAASYVLFTRRDIT